MTETILYKYAFGFLSQGKCGALPLYIMDSFLRFCFDTYHNYLINIIDKSLEYFFFCCFESWNYYHTHYLLNQKRRSNNYDSNTLLKYGFSTDAMEDTGDVAAAKLKHKYDDYCVEKIELKFIEFMVWLFEKQLSRSLFIDIFGDEQFKSMLLQWHGKFDHEFKKTKKHPFVYTSYIKKNNAKFILVPNEVQLLDAVENVFLIDPLSCLNIYLPNPFRILTNDKNCKNFIVNNYYLGNMKQYRQVIDYSKHKVIDSQNTILNNLRLKYTSCLPQYGDFGGIRDASLIRDIIHIGTNILDENSQDVFFEATKNGCGLCGHRTVVQMCRYYQQTYSQTESNKMISELRKLHHFALLRKISILNAIWCNLNNININDNIVKLTKFTAVYTKLNLEQYFCIKDNDIQHQLIQKRKKLGDKFEKKAKQYKIDCMAKIRKRICCKFNGNIFRTTLPVYQKTNHCCIISLQTVEHKSCIPMEIYWVDRAISDIGNRGSGSRHANIIDGILVRKFIERKGILSVIDMKLLKHVRKTNIVHNYTKSRHEKIERLCFNDINQLSAEWQNQFVDYAKKAHKLEKRIKSSQYKFNVPFGRIISRNGKYFIDIKRFDKKTTIKYCEFCGSCMKKSRKCNGCKITYYCDKICQKKDWLLRHKSICYQKRAWTSFTS